MRPAETSELMLRCPPTAGAGVVRLIPVFLVCMAACKVDTDPKGGSTSVGDSQTSGEGDSGASSEATGESGHCPDDGCLDLENADTGGTDDCGMETGSCECEAPQHTPCDHGEANLLYALGLNCEGETQYEVESWGSSAAFGTLTTFGNTDAFAPREGSRYAVIGSGRVADLPQTTGSVPDVYDLCSSDLGPFDPQLMLPMPIVALDVGPVTCADDPSLVGTGDCSNTLQRQFEPPGASGVVAANDYTELRFSTTVPPGVTSFSYDFAFMSFEYPGFWMSNFNDMYIGWLESEGWTGNISFDDNGNPITVNAGFMDYLDADTSASHPITGEELPHPDCPIGANCTAPELHGTCMQGHGATRWLTTTAGVSPGESITVVFAVMDLNDSILDSYAFLDNFQWGCAGGYPPKTIPID